VLQQVLLENVRDKPHHRRRFKRPGLENAF
jgi:hypothetical protein